MSELLKTLQQLKNIEQLIIIEEEVDPELEISAIQLLAYKNKLPAILFKNVKGSRFPAVCNLFGSVERSKYIFRNQWENVKKAISLKNDPLSALKNPLSNAGSLWTIKNALPKKVKWDASLFENILINDLPQIKCWPKDGGAFITLPQVYTEDPEKPGIMNANLGMYRIQLSGNEYKSNQEIGLHYQIHRGIGVHQSKSIQKNEPLKVSIFIGGHPAHTLAAVMPLPEGLSEMTFAGMLAGKRFEYAYDENGHCISMDADFIITGTIDEKIKPEGPFGDHLGYYSWVHDFPVMKVAKVYAKRNAIFPFTVVGRPPQEDTSFGNLIHQLTGDAIKNELPGIQEVHAVDESGVHPLLLAVGSERYTPYSENPKPMELLTQANKILGTGQLSLAKYLWITAPFNDEKIETHDIESFFHYILERIDWERDLHFQTSTTIDTLDYSGVKINEGSKVVIAAYGNKKRSLSETMLEEWQSLNPHVISKGIIAIEFQPFLDYASTKDQIEEIKLILKRATNEKCDEFPLIILCDDAKFIAEDFSNYLWVAFTRSNPSHDIYGIDEFVQHKHWGCKSSLIIDARKKPFMMPELEMPEEIMEKAMKILNPYL